jgi:hypothetical protein
MMLMTSAYSGFTVVDIRGSGGVYLCIDHIVHARELVHALPPLVQVRVAGFEGLGCKVERDSGGDLHDRVAAAVIEPGGVDGVAQTVDPGALVTTQNQY